MRELATEAFYLQIKTFKLERLVIMLDTCEWLSEPEGIEVGQWVLNELMPEIHTRIRQKGRQCSIVMFSRVQPKLDVIRGQDQRRLTLPMLGKAEVDHYLEHMGMRDAELRQRVYEVTHGHALCVSIIGDFWQQREAQEQPLTLADLPELQVQEFSEIALMRFTNERVLRQLKPPFKELTQYGVLLRSFDLPLLRTVFPELLPEPEALERFNQLIRYPFIESRGNYRYAFHELLREALPEETQKEDPEAWKGYHKRALDYLTTVSFHSPDWYYHLLAYDEKQGLEAWQQAIQEARESGKREYCGALLQAALDKALKLSLEAHAEIKYEEGRFNYYGVQWEEALKSYKEALASFKEIEDLPGHANCYQAIGDVQRALGKLDDALESYEKARAFYQQLGDQSGEARSCQAMGDVQRLRNDLDASLQCYERCLDLFRQVNDKLEEAKALEAVGDVQRMRNEQDAALKSYEQALALYQEEKDRLKRAKVLKAIGDVQQLRQERNAALESYGQALALYGELKEPAEEASVRQAVEEMGQPQSEQEAKEQTSPKSQPGQAIPVSATSPSQPLPIRPRLPKAQSPLKVGVILMIGLVLVLLAGSGSLIFYAHSGAANSLNANSTATAQATIIPSPTSATSTNTTPTTSSEPNSLLLYPPYTGTLALNDSLNDNSSNNWFEGGSSNGACVFTGGAYHVFAIQLETTISCPARATNFSNFAYQIQMTIIKGDFGGSIFRLNTNDNFYLFGISTKGSYNLSIHSKNSGFQTLSSGQSSAINTGLSQPNLIAIVASGSELDLYVNQQLISTVIDGTYNRGQIGVSASASQDQTEVMFSNAQVWTF
jgi:tetratricopeptide (TPR) repeat protein